MVDDAVEGLGLLHGEGVAVLGGLDVQDAQSCLAHDPNHLSPQFVPALFMYEETGIQSARMSFLLHEWIRATNRFKSECTPPTPQHRVGNLSVYVQKVAAFPSHDVL